MESLRQETLVHIDRPIRVRPGIVIASVVQRRFSKTLWTPPEDKPIVGDVVHAGEPRDVSVGDRVLIPKKIGYKIMYFGRPALMLNEWEILAVLGSAMVARIGHYEIRSHRYSYRIIHSFPDESKSEFTDRMKSVYVGINAFKILTGWSAAAYLKLPDEAEECP